MAGYGIKVDSLCAGILKDISFSLKKGQIGVIFGPNGAGKTTLLNAISGIIPIKRGKIFVEDKEISKTPVEERNISYIFQDLALFPHLTVFENIMFPLKIKKVPDASNRAAALLKKLGIEYLKYRFPGKLSGGEKQRVAIARALIVNPKILLLDEPFSSLDFEMRKFIRQEFISIIKQYNITTLLVTHDPYEAEETGDLMIKIKNGTIEREKEKKNSLQVQKLLPVNEEIAVAKFEGFDLIVPFNGKVRATKYIAEFSLDNLYVSSLKPPVPTLNTIRGEVISHNNKNGRVKINIKSGKHIITGDIPHYMWNQIESTSVYVIIKYRGIKIREVKNE